MSRIVRIFQVDAFTAERFTGNPAGVVLDAGQLSDAEMQAIARELNNGDTAFVLPPVSADHDLRVRFFTPRKEAAFVGHATLAAHAVLAALDPKPVRRQSGQTGIVEVQQLAGGAGFSIRQSAPPLGRMLDEPELAEALHLLGLTAAHLDLRCPVRIAGSASTRLLLGLRDPAALDAAKPQLRELAALSPRMGAQGYFLFTTATGRTDAQTEARMFCPALGIDEDPVSGNAHAMLGIYLHAHGLLPTTAGKAFFSGVQGRHVGRPGKLGVSIEVDAGDSAVAATISGQAVVVFEANLTL
jgi:PhzF family phenazine biosynthesis protein